MDAWAYPSATVSSLIEVSRRRLRFGAALRRAMMRAKVNLAINGSEMVIIRKLGSEFVIFCVQEKETTAEWCFFYTSGMRKFNHIVIPSRIALNRLWGA